MASPAWERRNKAARAKGYRNYYDYRLHQYGKVAPDIKVPPSEELSGHRGLKAFRKLLDTKPEQIALIVEAPGDRGTGGQYTSWRFIVTMDNADIDQYVITIPEGEADLDEWLDYWHDEFEDAEVDYITYSKEEG